MNFLDLPNDILEKLAVAVQQFFKSYPNMKLAPLHIAVEKGNLKLCDVSDILSAGNHISHLSSFV